METTTTITIDEKTFQYKRFQSRYIVSYMNNYPEGLVEKMYNTIQPMYDRTFKLVYSNLCGPNSKYVCQYFREKRLANETSMIIISDNDWKYSPSNKKREQNMKKIYNTYGPSGLLINISYHAIPYIQIMSETDEIIYHIAIETNISYPYKLQFYVGQTYEELSYILTARYLCISFKIVEDLDNWTNLI